jgi:ParB/RepB/Spo0J family partition protein
MTDVTLTSKSVHSFSEEVFMTATLSVPTIPVSSIRENPVALRAVNKEDEKYIGLRDSIRDVGVLNPINVREQKDDVTGEIYYELVDGLHRYSSACDVGITELPINIVDLNDSQTLEAQIMANVHRIETKPVQYTRQLQRMFAMNPTLTLTDMAAKLAKSPSWVGQRLNLLKLDGAVQDLVDGGKITVSNAVTLSKLPNEEQGNYVDQAMTLNADEFTPLVATRAKELADAKRQGRSKEPAVFVASPRLQKMSIIKDELESSVIGPELCSKNKLKKAAEGFALGVQWVLNMDPDSVAVRKAEDDARKQSVEDAKKQRAADRTKKKADEAAKLAAEAAEKIATPDKG